MKYITCQELWNAARKTECPPNYTWRHRGIIVTVFDSGKYHNQVEVTVSWPLGTVLLAGGWLDQQWIDFTGRPMFGHFLTSQQSHLTACGIIAAAWNSRKGESIIYAVRPDTVYGIERAKPVRGDWCGVCNSYQYSGRCRCGNICETCGNSHGDGGTSMDFLTTYKVYGNNACVHVDAIVSESANVYKEAVVESGALVGDDAFIGPWCHIGKGVVIGKGCVLARHSVIRPGAVLGENVFVSEGVRIGENTTIGSDSFIAPAVHVGDNCRTGRNCRIEYCATLADGVELEDNALVSPRQMVSKKE